MSTQATLTYTAYLAGITGAQAASLLSAVPLPIDLLDFYGVRVISDATPAASPIVRTIVLALNPSSSATAASVLLDNNSGSPVKGVTVTSPGSGYVVPPVVTFTGGRALLPEANETAFNMLTPSLDGPAAAIAYLKVVSAAVVSGGAGYSAATFIKVDGKLKSSGELSPIVGSPKETGVPAVLTPTILGGIITGVTVTSPGSGYVGIPKLTVIDPIGGGSGGAVSVSMGVGAIIVLRGGSGYNAPPTVVLTPYFQAVFPPTSLQAAPFRNLFTPIFEKALLSPVSAAAPVIV